MNRLEECGERADNRLAPFGRTGRHGSGEPNRLARAEHFLNSLGAPPPALLRTDSSGQLPPLRGIKGP